VEKQLEQLSGEKREIAGPLLLTLFSSIAGDFMFSGLRSLGCVQVETERNVAMMPAPIRGNRNRLTAEAAENAEELRVFLITKGAYENQTVRFEIWMADLALCAEGKSETDTGHCPARDRPGNGPFPHAAPGRAPFSLKARRSPGIMREQK
jgi:hypothetical protein